MKKLKTYLIGDTRRLLVAAMLFCLLFVSSSLHAQSIQFSKSKVTVKEAIEAIRSQVNYSVDYSGNILDKSKNISVTRGANQLRALLDKIVGDDLTYTFNDRHILITKKKSQPKESKTTESKNSHAKDSRPSEKKDSKTHPLTGTVVDASSGEPLIGVVVKFGQEGTITDVDGNFSIPAIGSYDELVVSYVGYNTKRILAGDLANITIQLQSADDMLDEVVVVGAGTQKKVSVTGAITTVKGADLIAPSSSLTNNLAGKLAGVITSTTSGEPGSASEFYIRGISTFGGRATPLILLDGVEISVNDLNNTPAENIESFSILKDASATAIYGARGANGVMIVTTKSGAENTKARINVTLETSMLKPVNMVDFADGATYMETYNEAQQARNPGMVLRYSEQAIANTRNHVNQYIYPDVDWYDLMFRDHTTSQRANVNVSGGGARVTYYMSLQANHDTGILDIPKTYSFDNNYNRWLYTFQNNIGYKITENTKVDLRMNAQIVNSKSPGAAASSIFSSIYTNTPVTFPAVFPAQEGDEHIRFGTAVMSAGRFYDNPYAYMLNKYQEQNYSKLNIALNINQKLDMITKGLSATALINFNSYASSYYTRTLNPFLYALTEGSYDPADPNSDFDNHNVQVGTQYINQSGITRNTDSTFYLDGRINYDRHFGKHAVTGMLMYMMREYRNNVLPNRNQGFSGRATYDYDNRYLAEINFGYNGTERLKEKRFEFFPAVSLGWVASNEKFWQPLENVIDYFKIRGSYGLVGSDETGTAAGAAHFLYQNSVSMSGGMSFSTGYTGGLTKSGPIVTAYAVLDPHWERATEFDLGIDMHIMNQLNITADYFHNKRDRILMQRASFPAILGYSTAVPWSNIGKVDSKGLELAVNWTKNFGKDLTVDLRGTYTYTKNIYEYVDEPDYPYVWQTNTGKSIGHMTGYIADGLFADQHDIDTHADQSLFGSVIMPGDVKYRDINGDGRITAEDRVELSEYGTTPRIQYGLGASVKWRHFDFNVYFTGSAKRRIMLSNIYPFCANNTNDRNLMQWVADNHWSEANPDPDALYPRLGYLDTQIANNNQASSYWMRDGKFIRFKTIELGYTFKYGRVYFSGDNIAVWSPFKMWDPELNYSSYPLQRTFNLGVKLNF